MVGGPGGQTAHEGNRALTKEGLGLAMRQLADKMYPQPQVIVSVMDNLNAHKKKPRCMKPWSRSRPSGSQISLRFIAPPGMAVG
jgi:hypothetical protein